MTEPNAGSLVANEVIAETVPSLSDEERQYLLLHGDEFIERIQFFTDGLAGNQPRTREAENLGRSGRSQRTTRPTDEADVVTSEP